MSGTDIRSVGELLVDNDLIARRLLRDADEADPRAVTRSWGEVVESAIDLWAALPTPGPGGKPDHQVMIEQVDVMNRQMARRSWGGGWPGEGGEDPRLAEMRANFERAADLVRRHHDRPEGTGSSATVRADVDAGRLRVMHSLYLASHAVGATLGRELKGFEDRDEARTRKHSPETIRGFQERVDGVEQLLGWAVARDWPSALAGEHTGFVDSSRLAESWAAWELQAHRALAHSPTTGTLAAVSMNQVSALVSGNNLVRAAALLEHVDPLEYRDRLGPALEASAHQWHGAAQAWQQITPQDTRGIDPALLQAGRELRAALIEIQRDGAVRATPQTMAARIDLTEATRTVHRAVIGSADLARAAQDVATDAPLVAPAKPLQKATQAVTERAHADHIDASPHATWISPKDLQRNTHVPLPQALREDLAQSMGKVITAAEIARNTSSSLQRTQPPSEAQSIGRLAEERQIPSPPPTARQPGLIP
ncbi:MAG: hypothetical protein L0G89_00015 [Janibacter sp.]|nr:hypothetical protein [Janibacter sp.]